MESNATPSSEVNIRPDEIWRRFTLLDLMILITGHGAAMGVLKWQGAFEHLRNWTILTICWYSTTVLLLGAVFSLPLVYAVQYYSRERRERIARGEIVAAILVAYWGLVFLVIRLEPSDYAILFMLAALSCFVAWLILVAIIMCFTDLFLKRNSVLCPWINYYGYFLCVLSIMETVFVFLELDCPR
jgi:hypothetical protein